MKTLIITDNKFSLDLAIYLNKKYGNIDIFQSPKGSLKQIDRIDVQKDQKKIISEYETVISIHCKQIFPNNLINSIKCINVHPGFNPYNRGWYPQIFSIINGFPVGVTIHEMDEQLDHGPIIVQEKCTIDPWDTSESVYLKIIELEKKILLNCYESIIKRQYTTFFPSEEGSLNQRNDFEKILKIDLSQTGTFAEFLNLLRALSHGEHKNAYFLDPQNNKVFVRVFLEKEQPENGIRIL